MGRDAIIMLSMRVAGTLLWMFYTIILARTLSRADFAVTVYVINFSFIAVLVVTLGRDVALLRFASKAWAVGARRSVRTLLWECRRIVLLNSCILIAGLVTAAWLGLQTSVTQTVQIALLSGLLTLAGAQMGLNRDCLRAVGQVWQSQMGLNFTRSVVPVLGSVVVIAMDTTMSAELALALFLLSLLLSVGVEEVFLRQIDWQGEAAADAPDHRALARAGLALWPGDMANALMMRSVGLVGALALQPEAAALLLAAERIAGLAQFPIAASAQAAAPRIAQATIGGDRAVQQALDRGSLLMAAGALIGCGGAAALAWPALWALGPDYIAALPTTLVLIAASLSSAFFGLAQAALNLTGRSHRYSVISICICGLTVAAIWLAASRHGGIGAAAAWCVGWWIANIAYTIAYRRASGLNTGIGAVAGQALAWVKARR